MEESDGLLKEFSQWNSKNDRAKQESLKTTKPKLELIF